MYFPGDAATPPRPLHVHQLENSRYIRDLLVTSAERWEAIWHHRARTLERAPDVHMMLDWWKHERAAWELVREVAVDYRHWRSRLRLLNGMRAWSDRYGFDAPVVSLRRYDEDPLSAEGPLTAPASTDVAAGDMRGTDGQPSEARLRNAGDEAIRATQARLAAIAKALPPCDDEGNGHALLPDLDRWQATLRMLDASDRPPRRFLVAPLCAHHAALWQLLREWLTESDDNVAVKERAFVDHVTRTAALWSVTLDRGRPGEMVRQLASTGRAGTGLRPAGVLRLQLADWWTHDRRNGTAQRQRTRTPGDAG